jgi:hypothetical protein
MDYNTWLELPRTIKFLESLENESSLMILSKAMRFCFNEGKKYGANAHMDDKRKEVKE